jgi:hypothetical protein
MKGVECGGQGKLMQLLSYYVKGNLRYKGVTHYIMC